MSSPTPGGGDQGGYCVPYPTPERKLWMGDGDEGKIGFPIRSNAQSRGGPCEPVWLTTAVAMPLHKCETQLAKEQGAAGRIMPTCNSRYSIDATRPVGSRNMTGLLPT